MQYPAAFGHEDVAPDADDGEEGTAGQLRRHVGRQLTLKEAGGRPGDRRESDEQPAASVLSRGVEHREQSRR